MHTNHRMVTSSAAWALIGGQIVCTGCTAVGTWALELVVCQIATQRKTGSGDYECDPVGPHECA